MNIILTPTTDAATSVDIVVPEKGFRMIMLHQLPLHEVSSGHKIEVNVGGVWKDYLAWPPRKKSIVISGPSVGTMTVRVQKTATPTAVGLCIDQAP